jgi:WD40 repeat protein
VSLGLHVDPDAAGNESVSDAEGHTAVRPADDVEATGSAPPPGSSGERYDFLAPAERPDEVGRLGGYRILRVLGAGGMGVVFEAEDTRLERKVALKAMLPALAASETARRRFLREARTAAAIEHDHIVPISQVGEERGVPFIAMPLLKGEALAGRLGRERVLAVTDVLRIGRETAQGLAAAHAAGLIHRDIKPANLWLESLPRQPGTASLAYRVKILDFGLARAAAVDDGLTQQGAIVGTPAYMAPEQAAGKVVDARCDLFSLGCVLYRMATGEAAFKGNDTVSMLLSVATEKPRPPRLVNPAVPAELSDFILRLLAKRPEERPPSAGAVAEALVTIERGLTQPLPPTAADRENRARAAGARLARRRLVLAIAAGLVLAAGVGVVAQRFIARAPGRQDGDASPEVPAGGDAHSGAPVEAAAGPNEHPFDTLRRADIPAPELAEAGGGDPGRAPAGLVAVLGDSRLMHWNNARRVAFHPDGKRLVSAADDGTVRIWDLATGQLVHSLKHQHAGVTGVAYSPNGQRLLTSGWWDGTVRVWDRGSDKPHLILREHAAPVNGAVFSPDGKRLASASNDQTAVIWDTNTGRRLQTFTGHVGPVRGVAFSRDGKRLATAGEDRTARVWDAATGRELTVCRGPGKAVTCVAFSPDGSLLATGSDDEMVALWDPAAGKMVRSVKVFGRMTDLAFSPDGKWLAVAGNGNPLLLDTATAKPVHVLGHTRPAAGVAFSPDGRRLATAGGIACCVRLWDTATGKEVLPHVGHRGPVLRLALSPDSRHLVSGSDDQTVRLWDTDTGREERALRASLGGGAVIGVGFSPDGRAVTAAQPDGVPSIRSWSVRDGSELPAPNVQGGIVDVCYHPSGRFLAGGVERMVQVWDVANWQLVRTLGGHRSNVSRVAYSPDGRRLASGDVSGTIKLWDAVTGDELFALPAVNGRVDSLAFSPDSRFLVPGASLAAPLCAWDVTTGKEARPIDASGGWGDVAFSPDGAILAAVNADGRLVLWDFATGQKRREWQSPGFLHSVAFAADGRHLLTGNGNGTIYVFRLPEPGRRSGRGVGGPAHKRAAPHAPKKHR